MTDWFILGYEKVVLWINDWIVEHRRRTDDAGLEACTQQKALWDGLQQTQSENPAAGEIGGTHTCLQNETKGRISKTVLSAMLVSSRQLEGNFQGNFLACHTSEAHSIQSVKEQVLHTLRQLQLGNSIWKVKYQ